jgi:hypothetical protein
MDISFCIAMHGKILYKASNSPKFDPDSPSADDQVPIGDAEIPTKISPQKFALDPSIYKLIS